jgi:hypothetical protein
VTQHRRGNLDDAQIVVIPLHNQLCRNGNPGRTDQQQALKKKGLRPGELRKIAGIVGSAAGPEEEWIKTGVAASLWMIGAISSRP